jgi:hypothetical protein
VPRETRTVADADADRQTARALRERKGQATIGDLVVATGIPEHQTRRSVERLLEDYESSVSVAKGGELVYRFALGAIGLKARRERRRLFGALVTAVATTVHLLVAGFRGAFRAILAVQLLVYLVLLLTPMTVVIGAVVGVALLVIGIVGAITEGGDIGGLLELLTEPIALALVLAGAIVYGTWLVFKKKVKFIMRIVGQDEGGRRGLLGFIGQVNDFALGPEKPPSRAERIDRAWAISQPDERRVLARVRARGGRLRAGDLVAWLGLDLETAETQAARIAVEYGGEPSATDLEVVEFELKLLMKTAGKAADEELAKEPTEFEREIPLPRLTGNRPQENFFITVFALANLGGGLLVGSWMSAKAAVAVTHAGWWAFGAQALGTLPVAFSLLLFGLVLVRVPGFWLTGWWRARRRRLAAVHRAIVAHAERAGEAPLNLVTLAREHEVSHDRLRLIALGLEGQFDLEGDAERTVWRWRRLARELRRDRAKAELEEASVEEHEG